MMLHTEYAIINFVYTYNLVLGFQAIKLKTTRNRIPSALYLKMG